MLEEILAYLRNWFCNDADKHFGAFSVEDGSITLPFLCNGQYFRIVGSKFNDGVYQYGQVLNLTDEEFDGAVWALSIPPAVLHIAREIEAWQTDHADGGVFKSESFGGYTYERMTNASGGVATWRTVFKSRLAQWRKAR